MAGKRPRASGSKSDHNQDNSTSSRRTLQCFIPGIAYQVKILLLFTQTLNRLITRDASIVCIITSEDPDGGKLDDVLIRYEDNNRKGRFFIQAKHIANQTNKKITLNDLITKQAKAPYAVAQYFQSFYEKLQHGRSGELRELVICTNAILSDEVKEIMKPYTFACTWLEETFGSLKGTATQIDLEKFKEYKEYEQICTNLTECSDCVRLAGALAEAIYHGKPVTRKDTLFSKYFGAIMKNIADVNSVLKEGFFKIKAQFLASQDPNDLFLKHFKEQYEHLKIGVDVRQDAESKGIKCTKSFIPSGNTSFPHDTVTNEQMEKYFKSFIFFTETLDEKKLSEQCKKQFESVSLLEGDCAHGLVFEELFNYVKEPAMEPLKNGKIQQIWQTKICQLQFLQMKGFTISRQQELQQLDLHLQESKLWEIPLCEELLNLTSCNGALCIKDDCCYDMLVVYEIIKAVLSEVHDAFEFLIMQASTFEKWQLTVTNVLRWLTAPLVLIIEVQHQSEKDRIVSCLENSKSIEHLPRMLIIFGPPTQASEGTLDVSCLSVQSAAGLGQRNLPLHGTSASVRDLIVDTDKLSFLIHMLSVNEPSQSLNRERFSKIEDTFVERGLMDYDSDRAIDRNAVNSKTLVIFDPPGNGKTSYATWNAHQLEQENPDHWILRFNAIEYSYELNEIAVSAKTDETLALHAVRILYQFAHMAIHLRNIHQSSDEATEAQRKAAKSGAEAMVSGADGKIQLDATKTASLPYEQLALLRLFLAKVNGKKIIILFDGFDEIMPDSKTVTLSLLSSLARLDNISRMCIISRPCDLKDEFQKTFSDVCFLKLEHFSEAHQLAYLSNLLKKLTPNKRYSDNDLIELSRMFLVHIKHSIRDLRKLPLFLYMMFELIVEKHYCTETLTFSLDKIGSIPEGMELTQLIEKFIELKLKITDTSKMGTTRAAAATSEARYRAEKHATEALQCHMALGYYALVRYEWNRQLKEGELDKATLEVARKCIEAVQTGIEKSGLVDRIIDGRPIFVHSLIMEYLAMRHMFQGRETIAHQIRTLYKDQVKYVSCLNMMDRISIRDSTNDLPLHLAVLHGDRKEIRRILNEIPSAIVKQDTFGRTALHLAAFWFKDSKFNSIFKQIIAVALERNCTDVKDTLFGIQAIDYALMAKRMNNIRCLNLKQCYLRPSVGPRLIMALKIIQTLALRCNDCRLEHKIIRPLLSENYLYPYRLDKVRKCDGRRTFASIMYYLLDVWRFLPDPDWVLQFKKIEGIELRAIRQMVKFTTEFLERNNHNLSCEDMVNPANMFDEKSEIPPKYIEIRVYVDEPSLIGKIWRKLSSINANGAVTRLKDEALTNRSGRVLLALCFSPIEKETSSIVQTGSSQTATCSELPVTILKTRKKPATE